MTFESPVARAIFVYWIIVVISWWLPGWYRIRLGRRGELGRTWRAHQEDFEEFLDRDSEAEKYKHLVRAPLLLGIRFGLSVGWPIAMGVYLYYFVFTRKRVTRRRRR